jgi:hypothetical protein
MHPEKRINKIQSWKASSVAIDRFTSQVIDKQIEVVNE